MKKISLIAFALANLAACATADDAGRRGPSTVDSEPQQQICRTITAIGTSLPKKTCATQAEWDVFEKKGQAGVDAFNTARDAAGAQGGLTGQ